MHLPDYQNKYCNNAISSIWLTNKERPCDLFQYHPDTCKSGSVQQNTKNFQDIVEAYRVLSKNESRTSYDASRYSSSDGTNNDSRPQNGTEYHYDYDYYKLRRQTYQNRDRNYYKYVTKKSTTLLQNSTYCCHW